ncbi:GNAT family N-acetyltransferase [Peribacillus sp. B-H-3]|jgi:GNAT superfamily N-acetyltransferase|uniref:GNAT family N-acetyltransferase n=1 Tax=Peribacillus sp. B-H-3 TaxID=3400420 RepID=UPI003B0287E6
MNILEIKPEDTYSIRHSVLRPNQPLDACKYDCDFNIDTLHFGAFKNEMLIGIATFLKSPNPDIPGSSHYQLRGMACLPEFQGIGAGRSLILYAEKVLRKRKADAWWCNARLSASKYYQKLGLQSAGDIFEIPHIGEHIVMFKMLDFG